MGGSLFSPAEEGTERGQPCPRRWSHWRACGFRVLFQRRFWSTGTAVRSPLRALQPKKQNQLPEQDRCRDIEDAAQAKSFKQGASREIRKRAGSRPYHV